MSKMNEDDLLRYGKSIHEIWYFDQKNQVIDGRTVQINSISPYKIPWNKEVDGDRPLDYFDKIETLMEFEHPEYGEVYVKISGSGRQEEISILDHDQNPIQISEEFQNILHMNKTFNPELMYDIIESLHMPGSSEKGQSHFVTPYIEVHQYGGDKKKKINKVNRDLIDLYVIALAKNDEQSQVLMPIVLTTGGENHHWYLCVLNKSSEGKYSISIIDSIHKVRDKIFTEEKPVLEQIKDEYRDQIINNINASLASHQQHVVEPNDINYSQILQYGLKGCGITTQYNMNSVLANRELPIFGDHDVQSADLLTGWIVEITDEASNDVRKIMLTPEQAESLMYDGEPLADVLKMPEVTLSTLYRDPCPFGKPV